MVTQRTPAELQAWFAERLGPPWFTAVPEVTFDRDEIVVLAVLDDADLTAGDDDGTRLVGVKRFREETREARIAVALEAEHRFGRKVSWGARCDDDRFVFTNVAAPVMTRLRMEERAVLDTLIDAGVARSRSEALAWCVRLVERNQSAWIEQLRAALVAVEEARAQGPDTS
jgi:hypothetical protein